VRPRIEQARAPACTRDVIEINSIAILKSAILAGMGATILPVAPLQAEVERGAMRALPISSPPIARTVVLCASKNIPLTNAAAAVSRPGGASRDRTLCAQRRLDRRMRAIRPEWLGAIIFSYSPIPIPYFRIRQKSLHCAPKSHKSGIHGRSRQRLPGAAEACAPAHLNTIWRHHA
jgi:hypothetical protein